MQSYHKSIQVQFGSFTLESRRAVLTERFFRRSVLHEASCLHYLLPDKRDSSVTDRLRHAKHSSQSKPELINFEILFCHSVYNILISIVIVFGLLDYGVSLSICILAYILHIAYCSIQPLAAILNKPIII